MALTIDVEMDHFSAEKIVRQAGEYCPCIACHTNIMCVDLYFCRKAKILLTCIDFLGWFGDYISGLPFDTTNVSARL